MTGQRGVMINLTAMDIELIKNSLNLRFEVLRDLLGRQKIKSKVLEADTQHTLRLLDSFNQEYPNGT